MGQLLNLDSLLAGVDAAADADDQNTNQKETNEDEDEEQEFEFRLFSAPTTTQKSTTATTENVKDEAQTKPSGGDKKETTQKLRIRLNSPTPGPADLSEGRFVKPFRGWEYYFTVPGLLAGSEDVDDQVANANLELKRRQFENVAVTGQNVMEWATVPWVSTFLSIWLIYGLKF